MVLLPFDHSPTARLRIAVTTAVNHGDMERLCPQRQLRWGRCDFLLNPPRGSACDYWIVFVGSRDHDQMVCAPQNTLFIAGEPPSKKVYPKDFYAQFHRVVSTHAADPHPRVTTSLPGLNWHVGLNRHDNRYSYGYDELKQLPPAAKSNKISVVCSNLTTTAGQRRRLAFLARLQAALGDAVIHYGRGFTPIDDKLDAILPHRFHLVLENSCSPDYWTEKLADAYLGWAYPVYSGCPNLGDYFPSRGFTAIDLDAPEASIQRIGTLLDSGPGEVEGAIAECRRLILDDYNPFARFAHWAETWYQTGLAAKPVHVVSHKAFRPFPKNWLYRVKSCFHLPASR